MSRNPRIIFGFSIIALVCFCGIFAPYLSIYSPEDMDIMLRIQPPSTDHWLGCDTNGRDVWSTLLFGARTSLFVAVAVVSLCVVMGSAIGLVSGYYRGWLDIILMRTVDVVMAVPGILIALVLAALLNPGIMNVVFAIAATGWTSSARLVRGQVLSLRERDYVTAARALGASDFRIMVFHILPGTFSPLLVHISFSLAGVILVESSLSFLGLGVQNAAPTWGALLGQGRTLLNEAPHLSVVPGVAIMMLVLGFNFLGDGLRDVLDPRRVR